MQKPHILVIPSWYASSQEVISGVYFTEQCLALKKSEFKVGVVTPIHYEFMTFLKELIKFRLPKYPLIRSTFNMENDIPVYRWHCLNVLTFKIPFLRKINLFFCKKNIMKLVDRYIKSNGKPDLIHAHCVYWAGYVSMHIAKKYNIPFIITEHSYHYDSIKRFTHSWRVQYFSSIVHSAAKLLTVSDRLGKDIQKIDDISYEVVPNVVDTQFFLLRPEKSNSTIKRFVSIAEFTRRKGLHLLLEGFAQAFKGNNDIILEIAGEGPEENLLKKMVFQLGIEHQVKFLGVLSRTQVRDALYSADAFILPSFREPFGVVFIEAMATGVPVIGTRSQGPKEIIVNEELGILIEPYSIMEIKNALILMLENIKSERYNPEYIRNHAVKNYSQEVLVEKLNTVYNTAMSGKRIISHNEVATVIS